MKIPEITVRAMAALAVACLCGLLGCGQAGDTPNSSDYANATEDYQAGRYKEAIAGFKRVLKSNPKDHLAHFQLATLLQDQEKDYLGALVHFRLYLDMRPPDDKQTLAADKIEECRSMLMAEKSRKGNGASADASSPADKKADRARVSEEAKNLREENKKLSEANKKLGEANKKLGAENKNLRYLVKQMGESGRGRAANLNAEVKKMLAELRVSDDEGEQRKLVIPTDKELLDDEGEGAPTVSSPEVKEQIAKVTREEDSSATRPTPIKKPELSPDELSGATRPPPIKKPPLIVDAAPEADPQPVPRSARSGAVDNFLGGGKKPSDSARPSTYKVQPGDSLMKIAERFYGSRSKWRDIQRENMATIPADGRVKAGQTIKLP